MNKSIKVLNGIGDKKSALFNKMGVFCLRDLLMLTPHRYQNIGETVPVNTLREYRGQKVAVLATIYKPITEARVKGNMLVTTVYACDESGGFKIVYFNNPYIKNMLKQDKTYIFYGKVSTVGAPGFTNPEHYDPDTLDKTLLPVYPLTQGINQRLMRKTVADAFDSATFVDPIPQQFRQRYGLLNIVEAFKGVHFPNTLADAQKARKRLVFEQLLYYSLGIRMLKGRRKTKTDIVINKFTKEFIEAHDFEATEAQKRAILEICSDLKSGSAMNRLLQGDVGSGKTFVAGQCAYSVIKGGYQAAMMVPTEVLANQHFKYFDEVFTPLGINVCLLTSAVTAAKKREIKQKIASGEIDFVVGTHAILQSDVEFLKLGLVITDEQHRFGVMQRAALSQKGKGVHLLVMSATPIPRTLALMLWGDLDLSVIDVMPKGRQAISTFVVDSNYNERLNAFIKKQTDLGGRVYVVCPLVEDEDGESDLTAATEQYKEYCEMFGEQNVGLVHGKMKSAQKEAAMLDFVSGKTKILVSTTVIEVGVNVPEATLMVIKNAERFGLSQLHQLRGRVGRGAQKSYCVLVSDSLGDTATERMSFFAKTTDGFKIANKDLEIRGPGNFFGTDQHGLAGTYALNHLDDITILEDASKCAGELLGVDPTLDVFFDIKKNVLSLFESKGEIFN